MRILVTGHKGFIGRNMMAWLNQEEEWLIEGWSWDPANLPNIKLYNWVIHLGAVTDTSDADIDTIIHKNYEFFGKKFVDALVDLPFALPTAVAGISLTALLAGNGWVGQYLEPWGIQLAFNPTGVVIALIFIGLPFHSSCNLSLNVKSKPINTNELMTLNQGPIKATSRFAVTNAKM